MAQTPPPFNPQTRPDSLVAPSALVTPPEPPSSIPQDTQATSDEPSPSSETASGAEAAGPRIYRVRRSFLNELARMDQALEVEADMEVIEDEPPVGPDVEIVPFVWWTDEDDEDEGDGEAEEDEYQTIEYD